MTLIKFKKNKTQLIYMLIFFMGGITMLIFGIIPRDWAQCEGCKCTSDSDCAYAKSKLYCDKSAKMCKGHKTKNIALIIGGILSILLSPLLSFDLGIMLDIIFLTFI